MIWLIQDQGAITDIAKRRRALQLPYTAHQILQRSLNDLRSTNKSRTWALPPTKFPEEVRHYSSRHNALGLKGPRPVLRSSIGNRTAEKLALRIGAALKLVELSNETDMMVKPVLLYYAFANLSGVYTRAFFGDWRGDRRTHGLKCHHNVKKVADIQVEILSSGLFPRLAATCFILSGWPNCFSQLVAYSSKPTAETGVGELLESFGKTEEGTPITNLSLDQLANFEYGDNLKTLRIRHGFHKFKGLPSTAFLVDAITLFLASSLARYDVLGWSEILEGRTNSFRIYFEETFERFENFTVNLLLTMLADPSTEFDHRLTPSRPSPYSHNDHSRFKDDPNYIT